jgi:hypothetical protein
VTRKRVPRHFSFSVPKLISHRFITRSQDYIPRILTDYSWLVSAQWLIDEVVPRIMYETHPHAHAVKRLNISRLRALKLFSFSFSFL